MSYGKELMFGISMLILIPIVMGYIGSEFSVSTATTEQSIDQELNDTGINNTNYDSNSNILIDTYNGYSLFPFWFNFLITALPLILVIRAVFSL